MQWIWPVFWEDKAAKKFERHRKFISLLQELNVQYNDAPLTQISGGGNYSAFHCFLKRNHFLSSEWEDCQHWRIIKSIARYTFSFCLEFLADMTGHWCIDCIRTWTIKVNSKMYHIWLNILHVQKEWSCTFCFRSWTDKRWHQSRFRALQKNPTQPHVRLD